MKGKYIDRIREYLEKTPVVNIRSISALVGNQNYAYVIMNHLFKRREVQKLTKGYYTIHEDPSLIVYCFKPAYLGLQDAMSFHNLWEQETNPLVITVRRVRCGVRKVFGTNVVIRRISPKYFFGFDYHNYGEFLLPVSDVEKTFIDMVYFKEMRKEMRKEFENRIDQRKLKSYLKKYPKNFRKRVVELLKT